MLKARSKRPSPPEEDLSWWLAKSITQSKYGHRLISYWISRKGYDWYAVDSPPVVGVIPKTLSKQPWSDWLLTESYPNVRIWRPNERRI